MRSYRNYWGRSRELDRGVLGRQGKRIHRSAAGAFTVTELMLAIALLGIIVYALYSVFNQTQKALRASIVQVDALESGRAALDLLTRDLEQVVAFDPPYWTNIWARPLPVVKPVVLEDINGRPLRTNMLEEFFFLSRQNQDWIGVGYRVIGAANGVGTLHRYSTNRHANITGTNDFVWHFQQSITNTRHVAEGVIHLRLRALDHVGNTYIWNMTNSPYANGITNGVHYFLTAGTPLGHAPNVLLTSQSRQPVPGGNMALTEYAFLSNALPAYLELEIGFLEQEALKQYNALRQAPGSVANDFLRKQAGKVHLFRKRIPIRIAAP